MIGILDSFQNKTTNALPQIPMKRFTCAGYSWVQKQLVVSASDDVSRSVSTNDFYAFCSCLCGTQGPAKNWEDMLLSLEVAGSEPGIEGDEIAPLAKENVATP